MSSLSAHLALKILDLSIFLNSLFFQLIQPLVLTLQVLSLVLDEYLEVIFVVQYLLEVLLHRLDKQLVLLKPLLHLLILLFKRTDARLYLPKLIIGLGEELLKFQVFFLCLTFKTL